MGWETRTLAGRTFDVLIQEREAECGPCCVAMVVNLLGRGQPTSTVVRAGPRAEEPVGAPPASVIPIGTVLRPRAQLARLQQMLRRWNIRSTVWGGGSTVAAAIAHAKAGEPLICHVTWRSGGGHWVVITHAQGTTHFILDPAYGLNVNNDTSIYAGVVQRTGTLGSTQTVAWGDWTGEWLKVDGAA